SSTAFTYVGSLHFEGQDFLMPLNSNMAFSGNFNRTPATQAQMAFLGNWAGRNYSGSARLTASQLYFNLSGPEMPVIRYRQSQNLLPLVADKWYQASVDESLYDNVCAH